MPKEKYLVKDLPIIYRKENFVVYRKYNMDFIVHNINLPFNKGHTHIKSYKFSIDIINYILEERIPYNLTYSQLKSMLRISTNERFKSKIRCLMIRKHRKNKQRYRNKSQQIPSNR